MTPVLRLGALGILFLLVAGTSAQDLNRAGVRAYEQGDWPTAERLFREALRAAPRDPIVHYHLGVTLTRLGRWREASEALESALRHQPPREIEAATRETLRGLRPMLTARRSTPSETIPLHRVQGVWVADVIVNGRYPARFLVDTGASVCVISPGLAERSGIRADPDGRPVTLMTLAGRTSGHLATIPSIAIGDLETRDVRAVVHPTGDAFDGILGNTFLGRYNAMLDPKRGVLELEAR